ncbi:zinc ribbon domain-containing protein [Methanobrevibacter sp.]|uniref:zinc ribbon domain-containing protein n=1 Tax=Methanobrevibacter sp. TaxID=66852 RepID=UPI00386EA943
MTKNCPKCGKELPDNAKFCMDCGYSIEKPSGNGNNILSNGRIFIVLIVIILVVGGIFILTSGFGGNNDTQTNDNVQDASSPVDMTITEVSGWDSEGDEDTKQSYTLYTEALFNKVPDDIKGYNVKTIYYDDNGSEIGHETEKLDEIYYDSSYALSFGYYTTYKLPDPDHVTVEIIKDGKVIDSYTEQIDRNKIDYLN